MSYNLNQILKELGLNPSCTTNYCKLLNIQLHEYPRNKSQIGYQITNEDFEILKFWCSKHTPLERRRLATLYTLHEKYGDDVDNVMDVKEYRDKIVETNLERHGVMYATQNKEILEKSKKTCMEKYGVDNASKSKVVTDKIKKTFLEKYGCENCFQNEQIKLKSRQTNIKKYGVPYVMQSAIVKKQSQQTNLKKYGSVCTLHGKNDERTRQIFIDKYGVENPFQLQGKYKYLGILFDSATELSYYIYHHDILKDDITRGKTFEYECDGSIHKYLCDFFVNGENVEIKGQHLINENLELIDFFGDGHVLKEKTQCMRNNNVKIIVSDSDEMKRIIKIVNDKFPSLVNSCKIKTNDDYNGLTIFDL